LTSQTDIDVARTMISFPNLLIVAGTGRRTGKTTLACEIIRRFGSDVSITAVKISPHFHERREGMNVVFGNGNYNIYEETDSVLEKDSSRMLKAGAVRVYYIETKDEFIRESFLKVYESIPAGMPVVCESPALGKYMKAGVLFLLDRRDDNGEKKNMTELVRAADMIMDLETALREENLGKIEFVVGKWKL
jgi:hypothetical protein